MASDASSMVTSERGGFLKHRGTEGTECLCFPGSSVFRIVLGWLARQALKHRGTEGTECLCFLCSSVFPTVLGWLTGRVFETPRHGGHGVSLLPLFPCVSYRPGVAGGAGF